MANDIISANQDAGNTKGPKNLAELMMKYVDDLAAGIVPARKFTDMADEFLVQSNDPRALQLIHEETKAQTTPTPTPTNSTPAATENLVQSKIMYYKVQIFPCSTCLVWVYY